MLIGLTIQNVVLIERLRIDFQAGFCALTGETGAGKSILLASLGLALGFRADSGLVRKGETQAVVTAEFQIENKHPVLALLREQGVEGDPTLILRRIVHEDGRSRAFINDQPVSIGLLRQAGDMLVEIHGQFETQGLLDPKTHRGLLDDYSGIDTAALVVCWEQWRQAEEDLEVARTEMKKARAEEDYLRGAVEDLDALSPVPGEEEELSERRARLMNREQVMEAFHTAYESLSGEGGAESRIAQAWRALDRAADKGGEAMQAVLETLDRAESEIRESLALIQSLTADLDEGEFTLEAIDERLFSLRAQARKHQCAVDDLPAIRDDLAARLNKIEHQDEMLADLMRAAQAARKAYVEKAQAVSRQRQKTALTLDKLVAKELPPLKLEKARFVSTVEPLPEESGWGPSGIDKVRFLVATNPGAEPGPLNKIASGGEMARFMLALKVVMAETGVAGSLVFDEVDAGIGGSTAAAVGERLARLASARQILVVTHAPQVAARASHHYIVAKDGREDVKTTVIPLSELAARREEIARMLAGVSITEEARAAAEKLLETGT